MSASRLRQAIGTLQDAIRSECKGGPDAPVEEAQAEVDAAIEELVGRPNGTVSEDGLKAARAEANALLVQPDFADAIVRAYLASTKPASPLPPVEWREETRLLKWADWIHDKAIEGALFGTVTTLENDMREVAAKMAELRASPPMPGRGEGSDAEALRVAREVISDMVRYGIISNEVGTTAYYVGDNVLPTIMGHPLSASRPQEEAEVALESSVAACPVCETPIRSTTKCACCGEVKPCPLRRDDMGGYVCLTCIDAALSAASAVRSEGVTVRAHKHTCANVQPGSTIDDKCNCGALDTAGNAIPLYTSPVQTREDGIREAADNAMNAYVDALVKREHGGIAASIFLAEIAVALGRNPTAEMETKRRALLSQPEPKGDKV